MSTMELLKIDAVKSYLKNFQGEKTRWNEVLGVTLCYGMLCLSRNYSLQGMSVNELREVTEFDKYKKHDYYKRNLNKNRNVTIKEDLHVKPSHSWRNGESKMVLSDDEDQENMFRNKNATMDHGLKVYDEPFGEPSAKFDEIDHFTKLFGKQFVDLAWSIYCETSLTHSNQLDGKYLRIDQRKHPKSFPEVSHVPHSFIDFLSGYITKCVSKYHDDIPREEENVSEVSYEDVSTVVRNEQEEESGVVEPTLPPSRKLATPTHRSSKQVKDSPIRKYQLFKQKQEKPIDRSGTSAGNKPLPKYLQHVQSKIKPELDARRGKVLRVRKNQTQIIKESLARSRLARYDEEHRQHDRFAQEVVKKMPLKEITSGAAALEIVDNFIQGPLMEKFGQSEQERSQSNSNSLPQDLLQEEIYGTESTTNDLGCKVQPQRKKCPESRERMRRDYSGWLGDFGPLHTKTVRNEWESEEDDEEEDLFRPNDRTKAFEWKFGEEEVDTNEVANEDKKDDSIHTAHSQSDSLSEISSTHSDPVFKWLKRAV